MSLGTIDGMSNGMAVEVKTTSAETFMSTLRPQRFFIAKHDDDDGVSPWFGLYDGSRLEPRNSTGVVCLASFDRQIDALIACVDANDREEKDSVL